MGYAEAETDEIKEDRAVARDVLFICLDWSMRLMHPLLPYLTEELYQRLPPSPTKYDSICVAPYPIGVIGWVNDAIDYEMEVAEEVAKKFRSQKTSLGFSPGARPRGFVRHADPYWQSKLGELVPRLSRMAAIGTVAVLDEGASAPPSCIRDVVSDKCVIFTEVKDLDLTQELAKLGKKMTSTEKLIASYEAKMAVPGYEEKVPQDVRDMNSQKLAAAKVEFEEFKR